MNYERFFLLVHGSIAKYIAMAKNNGKKVSYSRVQNELLGTIARVMSDFDCQVFFTENTSEAAMFMWLNYTTNYTNLHQDTGLRQSKE